MKLEQERLDDFQARMSEWVAKQGLLFQLRYAGSVKGAKNSALATVGRLFVRLLVLLVLAALLFWVYLIKRVDLNSFRQGLREDLATTLHAETLEVRGFRRNRGYLQLSSINLIGDEESAFEDLELRGVKTAMGLGDGLLVPWTGDSLQIDSMTAYVKGGASSDESAAAAFDSLFWSSQNFKLRTINVSQANLKWGYSASNSGQVVGSKMIATRKGGGWAMVLTGGEFSQNWLRRLTVDRIEAEITPDGFHIHEARLKMGEAEVSFTLELVGGGATPEFEGKGVFKNLPIGEMIEGQYLSLLDGRISGTFEVVGSTNKQTGFEITADVELGEGDQIELRDRIPLFRAISTADRFRSYKKVRFTTGDFRMKTGQGKVSLEDIAIVASRLMRIEGEFSVRPPAEEEVADRLDLNQRNAVALLGEEVEGLEDGDFTFSLRKAATKEDDEDRGEGLEPSILLNQNFGAEIGRNLAEGAREREFQNHFLDGAVRVGIMPGSFERSQNLAAEFPVDENTDMRWLELTWKASSPFEVGEDLAKRIFELSGDDY